MRFFIDLKGSEKAGLLLALLLGVPGGIGIMKPEYHIAGLAMTSLSLLGLAWLAIQHWWRPRPRIATATAAVLLVATAFVARDFFAATQPEKPTISAAGESQFKEIETLEFLDRTVGSKEPQALENDFDIEKIFNFNLAHIRKNGRGKRNDAEFYAADFGPQNVIVDLSLARKTIDNSGKVGVAPIKPGGVYFVYYSNRYQRGIDALKMYSNSALLPSDVRVALDGLRESISGNINTMCQLLNEAKLKDSKLITGSAAGDTYENILWNEYVSRAKPLDADIAKARAAIERHLPKQ